MKMNLKDWENNRWLRRHKTSRDEVRSLLAIVDRDLKDIDYDPVILLKPVRLHLTMDALSSEAAERLQVHLGCIRLSLTYKPFYLGARGKSPCCRRSRRTASR